MQHLYINLRQSSEVRSVVKNFLFKSDPYKIMVNDYKWLSIRKKVIFHEHKRLRFWITRIIVAKGAHNQRLTLLDTPIIYSSFRRMCTYNLFERNFQTLSSISNCQSKKEINSTTIIIYNVQSCINHQKSKVRINYIKNMYVLT